MKDLAIYPVGIPVPLWTDSDTLIVGDWNYKCFQFERPVTAIKFQALPLPVGATTPSLTLKEALCHDGGAYNANYLVEEIPLPGYQIVSVSTEGLGNFEAIFYVGNYSEPSLKGYVALLGVEY